MPPRIRIPKADDFRSLSPDLTLALHFPSPPESMTAILILLHGLGDSEASFASFARSMNLPGVLAIAVRGVNPLPPALLGGPATSGPPRHFHWGDDLNLAPSSGGLDADPGFTKATDLILDRLVRETLVDKCGWALSDVLFFGFGQGGALALGLASRAREGPRVEEVHEDKDGKPIETPRAFKGVVSVGGALPTSMISTVSDRAKAKTPVMVCHGRSCDAVDEDAVDLLKREFVDVREVKWNKAESTMPANREEMLPIMQFFAERLRSGLW